MGTTKEWPGGSANVTPASHTIPAGGELNWASLSDLLIALADGAQSTTFQKVAIRQATSTPVTVATTDCVVSIKLGSAGAVAVNLPAGANKQMFYIYDETGDAGTNTVTITRNGSDTIEGATTTTLVTNNECVILAYVAASTDWKIIGRIRPNPLATVIGGLTASRAVVSGSGGLLEAATTTAAEIGHVNGVTSPVVCTTKAQTLSSKTLVVSSNTITTAASGNLAATELNAALAELEAEITTNIGNISSATTTANAALPKAGGTMTGNIAMTGVGTVDGVDISARDTVLTNTTTTASAALPKAGGTMTGSIAMSGTDTVDGVDISARDTVLSSTTTTADAALPKAGGTMTGNIAMTGVGTVDGVDISARDTVLSSTTTTADAALPKAGGAMTGAITTNSTFDTRDVANDGTKLDGIAAGAQVTDATTVNAAGAVMNTDTSTSAMDFVIDEDGMGTDTATKVPTQQSVKAYVDANAGGGSGKNYVLNPDAKNDHTTGIASVASSGSWTIARTTTTAELPEPSKGTAFKISGSSIAVNDTVKWDILTTNIDDADGGRFGTAEMRVKDISGTVSGDYKIQAYNVTTSSYVGTSIEITGTGYYYVDVPLIAENDYQVHLIALITSPTNIGISGVTLGPVSASTGVIITPWQAYTPATAGWGSITSRLQWRQVGESVQIQGNIVSGTVSGTEARIDLPNNYTVDFKTPTNNIRVGDMVKYSTTTLRINYVLAQDGDTYIKFSVIDEGSSANPMTANDGDDFSSTTEYSIECSIPVAELKGTSLAVSDVQYANSRFTATALTSKSTSINTLEDIDTWTTTTLEGGGSFDGEAYTIPADGWYEVKVSFKWANASFGASIAEILIYKDSSAVNHSYESYSSANNPTQMASFAGRFSKGEVVKAKCRQNSGTIGLGTTAIESLFYVARVSDTSARKVSMPFPDGFVLFAEAAGSGAAGWGSTDTKIRRFGASADTETGDAFTVTSNATEGTYVTCNRDMIASIAWCDRLNAASAFEIGLSLNSAARTVAISSAVPPVLLALHQQSDDQSFHTIYITQNFSKGDKIRPHGDGNTSMQSGDHRSFFKAQEVFRLG